MELFDINKPQVKNHIQYLVDRSNVWDQKYVQQVPQTYPNDAMKNYHLCNVWRELDRFSVEEISRLRELDSFGDQVEMIVLARHSISWTTYDVITTPGCDIQDVYDHWDHCKKSTDTFVGNAIQMYPKPGNDRAMEIWKHKAEVDEKIGELIDYLESKPPAKEIIPTIGKMFKYIGPFKAYEIYTSLTYCEDFKYREDEVVFIGPGAIGSLNYITDRSFTVKNGLNALLELSEQVKDHLLLEVGEFKWIPAEWQGSPNFIDKYKFTVRTLEDSLCEFRKYNNFLSNSGRRRKYKK